MVVYIICAWDEDLGLGCKSCADRARKDRAQRDGAKMVVSVSTDPKIF